MSAAHPRGEPAGPVPAGGPDLRRAIRLPILATAAAALLAGLWAGLWRLGLDLPRGSSLAALHGPLLICGLFGTLVGLERAVALGRAWTFAAPWLSAAGTVALLAGAPQAAGGFAYAAAALVLTAASLLAVGLQPAAFTATLAAGAAAWLAGCLLWARGAAVPDLAGWWLAFLVLTIAGERLELSRLLPRRRGSLPAYLLAVALVAAGALRGLAGPGAALLGAGLLGLTAWLARHDVAGRGIRGRGQVRFMAACMLAGYAWLGTAGLVLVALPPGEAAFGYDMALHAVLIGFVLSMVFGHALVILPAVARVRLRFSPLLYGPLALLHGAVALRLGADLAGWEPGRRGSGLASAAALLAFALALAVAAGQARDGAAAQDAAAP
ncbi:conserved hypothetical protein [Methylobacterium sp. 4-46]|uniref:hypothetical protein n=1 Tax=unclassified Methylobacterium TaxID=2615210 RepID=UPI000165CD69|nr:MULTISPECIES: hypothetical protein [Methylobacterium]ACA20397.1 conserved hypothetical protein [Methylobacterium sp. 4-46]WFT79566.1 hypothetical protein QA634_30885 [Methylobacterium nodulans]